VSGYVKMAHRHPSIFVPETYEINDNINVRVNSLDVIIFRFSASSSCW
jgi:hypothetical protein